MSKRRGSTSVMGSSLCQALRQYSGTYQDEECENKTRETWERGRRRHPVSSQPPGVFLNSFYTRFLLNDFSPLSWSLEQAKWGVQGKTFLSDERQPEVMDFLQYSPVVWLSFLVKSVSRRAKTLSITNLAASRYIKRQNAPLAVGL